MVDEQKTAGEKLSWRQAWGKTPGPSRPSEYFSLGAKGFGMGTADLIPGVSGGTIAFITGIYEQLLEAVASLDRQAFYDLGRLRFKEFAGRVHLRFIMTLGFAMVSAIVVLARMMHFLLTEFPVPTWGLFFGLILASIVVIWRQLPKPFHWRSVLGLCGGAVLAFFVVGLIPVETPDDWWFIYLCGVIGISAMILPGLSGSFLLLILGKYEYITAALKNPMLGQNFLTLTIFLCGTFTGLLGFSKILNWLMKNYRDITMAVLTGILIGSLRKVWPWKEVLETAWIGSKERIISEANVWPADLAGQNLWAFIMIVVGFCAVMVMELSRQHSAVAKTN